MSTVFVASPDVPVSWHLIEARGHDTTTFLQGQLSCDVTALAPRTETAGLLLSPGGDVVSSLSCRHHGDGIDLLVRAESSEATLGSLRRFLLRTECELRDTGEAPGPYATLGQQILRGEPGPHEFARGLTAHAFGQAYVDRHVSFTKGCFTGQELVGRLDSRGGKVPFRLARVRGASLESLTVVVQSAGPTGDRALQGLTSAATGEEVVALAVVHRTLLGEERTGVIDGVRVELLHDGESDAR